MSVFTAVHEHQLIEFLKQFDCGTLRSFVGIAAGIENTNYFVTTDRADLVLTLFEHHQPEELHYFLDLMAYLADHGVPTAHPLCSRDGSYLSELNGKPAALVLRLTGHSIDEPNAEECRLMGAALGRLHRVSPGFTGYRTPDRALPWALEIHRLLADHLGPDDAALLTDELATQQAHPRNHLPQGAIHADLFRDNALFDDGQLSGMIDFYYACNDALAYDLAVTVNDWCRDESHHISPVLARAMVQGYQSVRAFNDDERTAWPLLLRAAALRFWLSRLKDQCFPRAGELTYAKDPNVFRALLRHHRDLADANHHWLT
ncbi:MAG: homoserine kinase [Halothiobacillus sp.]